MTSTRPKGLGQCPGKIAGQITNNCSEKVYCAWHLTTGGGEGASYLSPSKTLSGDSGGVWSCNAPTGANYWLKCTTAAAYDAGGCPMTEK